MGEFLRSQTLQVVRRKRSSAKAAGHETAGACPCELRPATRLGFPFFELLSDSGDTETVLIITKTSALDAISKKCFAKIKLGLVKNYVQRSFARLSLFSTFRAALLH